MGVLFATSVPGLRLLQRAGRRLSGHVHPPMSPPGRRALSIPPRRFPLPRPAAYRLLLTAALDAADHQVGVEHRFEGAGALGPAVAEGLHAAVVAPVAHRAHGAGPHAPRAAVDAVDADHPAGGGGAAGCPARSPPALPCLPCPALSAAAALPPPPVEAGPGRAGFGGGSRQRRGRPAPPAAANGGPAVGIPPGGLHPYR